MVVVATLALIALAGMGALVVAWVASARGDGGRSAAVVGVAALGALGLLAVMLVVGGVDTGDGGSDTRGPSTDTTVVRRESDAVPLQGADVQLVARDRDDLPPVPASLGGLADGSAVVVAVAGMEPGSRATVHQCPAGALRPASCQPGLPFRLSEHRRATVLVELSEELGTGSDRVDCTEIACSIVVFGSARLEVLTTFGGPAPPPIIVRTHPREVEPGGEVTATAEHLPPGARAAFAVCRPGGDATIDCGARTPARTADGAGTAEATISVGSGRCPRGESCAVVVSVEGSGPRAYARLRVIGRGGVTYEDDRLQVGLVAAGLLLAGALLLLRRTDWTPVEGDPFAGVVVPADPFADDAPP